MDKLEELIETGRALRGRMVQLSNDAKTILGRADAESRDLTHKEALRHDSICKDFDAVETELAKVDKEISEERARREDAINGRSLGRVVPPQAGRPLNDDLGAKFTLKAGPQNFANLFPAEPINGRTALGGFANLGEFARAVYERDPRLFTNASGMSSTVGTEGGFYIPPGFLAGLVDASLQAESVRPRATVVPMATSTVTIPLFDTTDRSSKIADLEGKPTQEGATAATQKAAVSKAELKAGKLVVLVPVTEELMADAPAIFAALLQRYMVEAISAKADYVFLHGTGAGEALGIVNAPATVVQTKEASQAAATIVPENLAKMIGRLAPGSFARAVWLANSSILPQLFLLAVKVKNQAGTENVGGFGPNWFTVAPDGSMQLFGRPLIVTDRAAALGTKGDIVLADLSQYLIGLRQDATLALDQSVGFKEGEIWFKVTMRVDGQPMLKTAITPRLGGSALSPFVVLETRA